MTQEALQSSSLTELIPQLGLSLVEQGVAILVAPPGSGKTTHVPLALLEQDWLRGQRILMLEPRRLAARSAATFMARTLGEERHTVTFLRSSVEVSNACSSLRWTFHHSARRTLG